MALALARNELAVLGYSYLLAGLPIAAAALAGAVTPLYRLARADLARWWSWGALLVAASSILVNCVLPLL